MEIVLSADFEGDEDDDLPPLENPGSLRYRMIQTAHAQRVHDSPNVEGNTQMPPDTRDGGETKIEEETSNNEPIKKPSEESSNEFSQESSKESSKELSKESSKESSKELSKESSKESSKQSSNESSKEPNKEFSTESSKESSKQSNKEPSTSNLELPLVSLCDISINMPVETPKSTGPSTLQRLHSEYLSKGNLEFSTSYFNDIFYSKCQQALHVSGFIISYLVGATLSSWFSGWRVVVIISYYWLCISHFVWFFVRGSASLRDQINYKLYLLDIQAILAAVATGVVMFVYLPWMPGNPSLAMTYFAVLFHSGIATSGLTMIKVPRTDGWKIRLKFFIKMWAHYTDVSSDLAMGVSLVMGGRDLPLGVVVLVFGFGDSIGFVMKWLLPSIPSPVNAWVAGAGIFSEIPVLVGSSIYLKTEDNVVIAGISIASTSWTICTNIFVLWRARKQHREQKQRAEQKRDAEQEHSTQLENVVGV